MRRKSFSMSARGKPVSRGMVPLRLDGEDMAADDVAHDGVAEPALASLTTVRRDVTVQEQAGAEPADQPREGGEALLGPGVAPPPPPRARRGLGPPAAHRAAPAAAPP